MDPQWSLSQAAMSVMCCLGPLALVGLGALGLSVYALVTGQGGALVRRDGTKVAAGAGSTRVMAVIGIVAGLFFICLAASLAVPVLLLLLGVPVAHY
jgi:hypothetical protein